MYTPSTLVTLLALFAYATMLEAAPLSRRSHASLALRLRQSSSANNTQYGCGSNPSWDFDSTGHSNQTLGDRSFLVHIPADYKSTTKHAMVLSFHGFKGDDLQQEKISQFSEPGLTVNGAGIISVYPMGAFGPGKTGNDTARAWEGAPYSAPGVDDIAFTQSMLQTLQQNLCVDTQRIYAAGKSEGGGFTNLLACTPATSSLFAAVAPVSAALYAGTLPLSGCNSSRIMPMITFHGTADKIIPFEGRSHDKTGNTSYATPDIDQWRGSQAGRNSCNSTQSHTLLQVPGLAKTDQTEQNLWNCTASNANAVTQGFTVSGLGHSWPTTAGLDDGGVAPFNATQAFIVPFFEQHTLDSSDDVVLQDSTTSSTNGSTASTVPSTSTSTSNLSATPISNGSGQRSYPRVSASIIAATMAIAYTQFA